MGRIYKTLFRVSRAAATASVIGCALLWPVPSAVRAQNNQVKDAGEFSSVDYFDPPNQMQVSSRMSGAQAQPVSANLMLIKQMKLETFDTNGAAKYIVEAPECLYDRSKGVASSPGPLRVRQADGDVDLTGVGFLWREDDKFLTISNQVHTHFKTGPGLKTIP